LRTARSGPLRRHSGSMVLVALTYAARNNRRCCASLPCQENLA
jgi:hypothetical protein